MADLIDLAKKAVECFSKVEVTADFHDMNKLAILGYFEGVSNGTITQGQSWAGDIIRGAKSSHSEVHRLARQLYSQGELMKDIFASGMCCDNQALGIERARSFAAR